MTRTLRLPLSSPVAMHATERGIWVVDRDSHTLTCFDARDGHRMEQAPMGHAPTGAAAAEGVAAALGAAPPGAGYRLSPEGVLEAPDGRTVSIREAVGAGAVTACANAVWISVQKGLLLIDQHELKHRATVDAPEGPVPHLICADGKIVGGHHGVFVLNPMTDHRAHPLPVQPKSPLSAIAANSAVVWALESAEPIVHITDLL